MPQVFEIPKMKDLAPVSVTGKDVYEKFEYSLPFCRTAAIDFFKAVHVANLDCGNEKFVTIEALAKVFTTPAWASLN